MAVANEQEESVARAQGWTDYYTDVSMQDGTLVLAPVDSVVEPTPLPDDVQPEPEAPVRRKPGRPRKV